MPFKLKAQFEFRGLRQKLSTLSYKRMTNNIYYNNNGDCQPS